MESATLDNATLARFDDPRGEGVVSEADSIEHDFRVALEADPSLRNKAFLDEDGNRRTLGDILDELDNERAAAEALRGCL